MPAEIQKDKHNPIVTHRINDGREKIKILKDDDFGLTLIALHTYGGNFSIFVGIYSLYRVYVAYPYRS